MSPDTKKSIREGLVLRPAVIPEDEEFIRELYFTSRGDLDAVPVSEEMRRSLLLMQYKAQTVAYAQQCPEATHEIVELDGQRIGRVIIDRQPEVVCIVDMALIPERRNEGIGTALLGRVMDECARKNLPCTLQVLISNPARALYERLGFRIENDDGVRLSMRWSS